MDQLQARIDEFHSRIALAADRGDLEAIRTLVAGGPGLAFQSGDEDLLSNVLFAIGRDCPHRYDAIRLLLDLGADPNIISTLTGWTSLMTPIWWMDTAMLRLLLDYGADPNVTHGFEASETLFSYARWDYGFNTDLWSKVDNPQCFEDEDEDLLYIDRMAVAVGVQRPDHLFLLREHGALSTQEVAASLGAGPGTYIEWIEGWRIVEPKEPKADPAPTDDP